VRQATSDEVLTYQFDRELREGIRQEERSKVLRGASYRDRVNGVANVPSETYDEGMFVPLLVYGEHLWANVDTGASVSILKEESLNRLRLKADIPSWSCDNDVQVASGACWNLTEKVRIPYSLGGIDFEWEFYVSKDITEDVIMGLDAIRQCAMDTCLAKNPAEERDSIYLREHKLRIPASRSPGGAISSYSCDLVLQKNVITIPKRYAKQVELRPPRGTKLEWNGDQDLITGVVERCLRTKYPGLTVHRVCDEMKKGSIQVWLKNTTNESITIWPEEAVASFTLKKVRVHKDEDGNHYLYRDPNGRLYKRMEMCAPWEDFSRDFEVFQQSQLIGTLPVAKQVEKIYYDYTDSHKAKKGQDGERRGLLGRDTRRLVFPLRANRGESLCICRQAPSFF